MPTTAMVLKRILAGRRDPRRTRREHVAVVVDMVFVGKRDLLRWLGAGRGGAAG